MIPDANSKETLGLFFFLLQGFVKGGDRLGVHFLTDEAVNLQLQSLGFAKSFHREGQSTGSRIGIDSKLFEEGIGIYFFSH